MSRLVNQTVPLITGEGDQPLRFYWQGQWHRVYYIFDSWREAGAWWEGEPEKTFYRVAAGDGLYELYTDGVNWGIYKILD